ncbi:hypothetical protein LF1_24120 [Rubripirellula obstinata]|uniref:Uncharacterized protein n=1 Tax=Rubripirellula obstinata TaxID=406547 RepID=A0A5B1CIY4_9BACT|nr:hypothetical protein LF1_24120 [Rubripirellula obstinata]
MVSELPRFGSTFPAERSVDQIIVAFRSAKDASTNAAFAEQKATINLDLSGNGEPLPVRPPAVR